MNVRKDQGEYTLLGKDISVVSRLTFRLDPSGTTSFEGSHPDQDILSNEADIDDQDDDSNDNQDFHSLPTDWPPQYTPQSSMTSEEELNIDQEPDPITISNHRATHPKVIINIGGVKHEVMWKMLEKRPLTRLGMLAKAKTHEDILNLVDAYSLAKNEFSVVFQLQLYNLTVLI